ncbi:Copper resistance protein CRF1 [Termitomyces sp. T112]|nr:Copper resistance protein CRF1 [Termitomyces sp. T112]
MVLLNGNKYACETCIKGHRSSNCRHTDRPLFEIKKKGRPVTQCDHCRELRKTKQVHVKCICEAREDHPPAQSSGTKKGHTKIPDCATFPNGLPQALGASVAESSSESEHGGLRSNSNCLCKTAAGCHCCIPRKSAPKNRKKDPPLQHAIPLAPIPIEPVGAGAPTSSSRNPSHILARLAELRPVLPRPSYRNRSRSDSGPAHDPSSHSAHGHTIARRGHENAFFSPYGRAYDANHDHFDNITAQKQNNSNQSNSISLSQNNIPISSPSVDSPTFPTDEQIFRDQLRALEAAANANTAWPPGMEGVIPSFPSTCGCGDNCRCPGCVEHNPDASPASSAFSSCMNPSSCTTCLDCTILSLPASLPADTALSIYDLQTSLDDWIRDVSSLPPRIPSADVPPPPPPPPPTGAPGLVQPEQPPSPWDGYIPPMTDQMSTDNAFGYSVKPCCGVLCKCDPDTCECNIDDENGYDCRREMLFPTFNQQQQQQRTTFPENQTIPQLDNNSHAVFERGRGRAGGYFDANAGIDFEPGRFFGGYSEPPRSRSSSTSTSSSQSQSTSSRGLPTSRPHQHQHQHNSSPFTTQPLPQEYGNSNPYPWQPPGRVVRGSFYAGQGQTSSISSPNLGLRLQTERSTSRGSSPASVSPALSAPPSRWD